jgi:ribosomal protein L37E
MQRQEHATCPRCGGTSAKAIRFTWWGGVLGPKLLHHVKCEACGTAFNGKTGNSNGAGIAIYFAVIALLAFLIMAVLGIVLSQV